MDEVDDVELLVERVAALDLGKAVLEACVRVPHPQRPGRRMLELRGYGTTTAHLLAMVAWLRHWHGGWRWSPPAPTGSACTTFSKPRASITGWSTPAR